MKVTNKPILLVEDDQVDTMTVIRALKEIQVKNEVVHSENSEGALLYLQDAASNKPCLIEHARYERDRPVVHYEIIYILSIMRDTLPLAIFATVGHSSTRGNRPRKT